MDEVRAQYDRPWKEAITVYFEQLLFRCFGAIHQEIDWSRGFNVLEQELQEIVGEAESENLFADKLFQVWLLSGQEVWVLIHIEIQSQVDLDFEKRMYQYNYRAFDKYEKPVISLALLGDDVASWQPSSYRYGFGGFRLQMDFPCVKILSYRSEWERLEKEPNPISFLLRTHLKTKETTGDLEERERWKWILAQSLFEQGYPEADIILLFRLLDKMMALSASLQQGFKRKLKNYEEERKMPFLSTIEEEAMEKGMEKGIQQGIQQNIRDNIRIILLMRFPELPPEVSQSLTNISDITLLQQLFTQALTVTSIAEFQQLLP